MSIGIAGFLGNQRQTRCLYGIVRRQMRVAVTGTCRSHLNLRLDFHRFDRLRQGAGIAPTAAGFGLAVALGSWELAPSGLVLP